MRIGELAEATGVSVRNIRYYTQTGLLPRPQMRGRVGLYGDEHVWRLALVARLQGRGYSLAAIADMIEHQVPAVLVDGPGPHPSDPLGRDATHTSVAALALVVPELAEDPALVERLVELDLLERGPGGDSYRVPHPALLRAGLALVARGVPVAVALDELARLRTELTAIAGRFAEIFERDMVPAAGAGRSTADSAADLLTQVWPSVLVAVGSVLTDSMHTAVGRHVAPDPPEPG